MAPCPPSHSAIFSFFKNDSSSLKHLSASDFAVSESSGRLPIDVSRAASDANTAALLDDVRVGVGEAYAEARLTIFGGAGLGDCVTRRGMS